MGVGGCAIGDHGALDDKEVRKEALGNNRVICSSDTNVRNLYRRREDVGVQ